MSRVFKYYFPSLAANYIIIQGTLSIYDHAYNTFCRCGFQWKCQKSLKILFIAVNACTYLRVFMEKKTTGIPQHRTCNLTNASCEWMEKWRPQQQHNVQNSIPGSFGKPPLHVRPRVTRVVLRGNWPSGFLYIIYVLCINDPFL